MKQPRKSNCYHLNSSQVSPRAFPLCPLSAEVFFHTFWSIPKSSLNSPSGVSVCSLFISLSLWLTLGWDPAELGVLGHCLRSSCSSSQGSLVQSPSEPTILLNWERRKSCGCSHAPSVHFMVCNADWSHRVKYDVLCQFRLFPRGLKQ